MFSVKGPHKVNKNLKIFLPLFELGPYCQKRKCFIPNINYKVPPRPLFGCAYVWGYLTGRVDFTDKIQSKNYMALECLLLLWMRIKCLIFLYWLSWRQFCYFRASLKGHMKKKWWMIKHNLSHVDSAKRWSVVFNQWEHLFSSF